LERFDDYWGGKAYIEEVYMQGSISPDTPQLDLIVGTIDACLFPQDPDQFDDHEGIELIEYPGDVGVGGVSLVLIMPIDYVNFTIRKALAYSYDYNLHVENLYNGYAIPAGGIIPTNNLYYNASVPKPYQNFTIARQTLLDDPGTAARAAEHGLTLDSTDAEWVAASASGSPLANFTYWYEENGKDKGEILIPNAAKLGIYIDWVHKDAQFLYDYWVDGFGDGRRDLIPLALMYPHLGDGPDPRNGIHGAYESTNFYNWAGVNDSELDTMIWDSWFNGYGEDTDPTMQEHLDAIVYKVQNEIIPMIWMTQTTRKTAISTEWQAGGDTYGDTDVQIGMRENMAYLSDVVPRGGVPTTQDIPPTTQVILGISLEALGIVSAIAIVGAIYVIKRKSTVY
jgi:hypothetical protein